VNSKNLYYINDITKRFKILIDTGAGLSIYRPHMFDTPREINKENVVIQGITNEKVNITKSTMVHFKPGDPHKIFIHDIDIDFDGLLGSDFLEHYKCIVDLDNRQLITNFKTVPLFKVSNDDKIEVQNRNFENVINIEPRTEKICKFNCQYSNTEAVLSAQEMDKVRLPNALVKINEKGEFLTSVINPHAIPKTINFQNLILEPINNFSINSFNENNVSSEIIDRTEIIKEMLRLDHLNNEEQELITNLCLDFSDIFYLEGDKLTFTNEIKHRIDTNDSKPIFTKSYRYPQIHKQEVKKQINDMLDQGIIRHSISPWSSPVWVVPKKLDASGKQKWRVVIDYRKLNEITVDDKYPLPNISDLLDQLGKCEYFTTLDLASGFHQLEIHPEDIPKTAFSVENGHFEFIRMSFGLKNAPSTFQRVMDNILLGIQNERCLVYMDDIIVYSPTIQEHIARLTDVFKRLRKANLKIQPDKCEFLRKEVAYLGHLVTKDGVKPNPDKIKCIENFPEPKNQKQIKSFLGLSGYYRRFIPNFAKISKPLTKLLQKDVQFNFDSECRKSFNELKQAIITSPILIYPNFDEPFILTTDASAYAIGAVLSQGQINKDLPIAFASRTLCPAETKYSTIERELLAIVWAVKHFRPYLYGRKFKLVTDHRPLTWLFSIKDPGSRLARWRLKLEEYDYEIIYKPGRINKNADALSRIKINYFKNCAKFQTKVYASNENSPEHDTPQHETPQPETPQPENPQPEQNPDNDEVDDQKLTEEYNTFVDRYHNTCLIDYSKIEYINKQLLDKTNKNIITLFWQNKMQDFHNFILEDILSPDDDNFEMDFNKINVYNSSSIKDRKYYIIALTYDPDSVVERLFFTLYKDQDALDISKTYFIENNVTLPILEILSYIFAEKDIKIKVCQDLITTPSKDEIPIILDQYHAGKNNLHRGINETLRRIKQKYNWPGITKDVENLIRKCEICQKVKICRKNLSQPLVITETPKTPFERINIDILEIPQKNYVLTIRDELTKFTQAYCLDDKSARSVVDSLILYFQHFGTPLRIHCDSGKEFDNTLVKDLCKLYDIKITYSSVNHPMSNGSLERFHGTLLEMIRAHKIENPDEHPLTVLPYAIICYNNTQNKTHGFTPYELIFGHTSSRPPETLYNEKELITRYIRDLNKRISYYYKVARERTQDQKEKAKVRFDRNISEHKYKYKIGDKVYVKESQISNKLQDKFHGPFEILEIFQNSAILVNWKTRQKTKVNFDRLKPCYDTDPEESQKSEIENIDVPGTSREKSPDQ
jgi:RNase H-like domain found in reverse transcriptase/Reverse transcriptase (RNA-dependent DNA polymerase)/Integrase zinc binding domain/Integrase core domain